MSNDEKRPAPPQSEQPAKMIVDEPNRVEFLSHADQQTAAVLKQTPAMAANAEETSSSEVVPPLRRGKWCREEEEYAERLIQEFMAGILPLTDGTTLRAFLSQLLHCDPMRISKKFAGSNSIGKHKFRRSDANRFTAEQLQQKRAELCELERRYLDRVTRNQRVRTNTESPQHATPKSANLTQQQQQQQQQVPKQQQQIPMQRQEHQSYQKDRPKRGPDEKETSPSPSWNHIIKVGRQDQPSTLQHAPWQPPVSSGIEKPPQPIQLIPRTTAPPPPPPPPSHPNTVAMTNKGDECDHNDAQLRSVRQHRAAKSLSMNSVDFLQSMLEDDLTEEARQNASQTTSFHDVSMSDMQATAQSAWDQEPIATAVPRRHPNDGMVIWRTHSSHIHGRIPENHSLPQSDISEEGDEFGSKNSLLEFQPFAHVQEPPIKHPGQVDTLVRSQSSTARSLQRAAVGNIPRTQSLSNATFPNTAACLEQNTTNNTQRMTSEAHHGDAMDQTMVDATIDSWPQIGRTPVSSSALEQAKAAEAKKP